MNLSFFLFARNKNLNLNKKIQCIVDYETILRMLLLTVWCYTLKVYLK